MANVFSEWRESVYDAIELITHIHDYLVWADNADVVSCAYSGTGALKTDFTRYLHMRHKWAIGSTK